MKKNDEKPQEYLRFEQYIDAVGDGATRSRSIIALLMTATLVAFLGLFNSLVKNFNWLSSRLEMNRELINWVVFPDDSIQHKVQMPFKKADLIRPVKSDTVLTVYGLTWPELRDILLTEKIIDSSFCYRPARWSGLISAKELKMSSHLRFQIPKYYLSYPNFKLQKLDKKKAQKVLMACEHLSVGTRKELSDIIQMLDRARIENATLVRMPVLGISFDVNWLSLISPAAFSIILFMLFYSLSRERKNLLLVFKLAEKKKIDKVDFYRLLSMRQVLTVPMSIDEFIPEEHQKERRKQKEIKNSEWEKRFRSITNRLARYPLYMPVFVWICIIAHDLFTFWAGNSINTQLTWINFGFSLIVGAFMFFFIYACWREWDDILEIWEDEAKEIKDSHTPNIQP